MSIESNLRFLVDYRWGGGDVRLHNDEARALLAVVDAAREMIEPYRADGLGIPAFAQRLDTALAELEAEA